MWSNNKCRIENKFIGIEERSGFCVGRSRIDNVLCLKRVSKKENHWDWRLMWYSLTFIKLNSVPLLELLQVLKHEVISSVYVYRKLNNYTAI